MPSTIAPVSAAPSVSTASTASTASTMSSSPRSAATDSPPSDDPTSSALTKVVAERPLISDYPLRSSESPEAKDLNTSKDAKPARKRRWSSKTRSGCSTCRARHIKCDERRPVCLRCVLAGRQCPGYPTERVAPFLHQPAVSESPPGVASNEKERRIFGLLRTDTVQQVSGVFDRAFWSQHFLRATHVYPAVWHASLALSAAHTRAKVNGTSEMADFARKQYYEFALTEYNASIKHLIAISQKPKPTVADQEAMLLTNALFTGLGCVQGDFTQAVIHAQSGLRLFRQWKFWERLDDSEASKTDRVLPAESMVALFAHTEIQFINRLRLMDRPPWRDETVVEPCSAVPYKTVTDAYFEFQDILAGLLAAGQYFGTPVEAMPIRPSPDLLHGYRVVFRDWCSKFKTFLLSEYPQPEDEEAIAYLKLYRLAVSLCLQIDHSKGVYAWDSVVAGFKEMVRLAQQLYTRLIHAPEHENSDSLGFSFSSSVCELLYFSGISCRDNQVRRDVIRLLRKWPRRDGIWDSKVIADILEAIKNVEDFGREREDVPGDEDCKCVAGVSICSGHRVCYQDVQFLTHGSVKVMATTNYCLQNNLPPVEVIIGPYWQKWQ